MAKTYVYISRWNEWAGDPGIGLLEFNPENGEMKFLENLEEYLSWGGAVIDKEKNVMYITERAVFKLVKGGIMLIETAPGIDIQKDILDQMEFAPIISESLSVMSADIFTDEVMGWIL